MTKKNHLNTDLWPLKANDIVNNFALNIYDYLYAMLVGWYEIMFECSLLRNRLIGCIFTARQPNEIEGFHSKHVINSIQPILFGSSKTKPTDSPQIPIVINDESHN